jgi:hypothetical protein
MINKIKQAIKFIWEVLEETGRLRAEKHLKTGSWY